VAVARMRRLMIFAVETVKAGGVPPYVLKPGDADPIDEMMVRSQSLPADVDVLSRWWANR
jgi:ActR/RegA family two-component response regulator